MNRKEKRQTRQILDGNDHSKSPFKDSFLSLFLEQSLSFLHVIDVLKLSCTSKSFLSAASTVFLAIESIEIRNIPLIDDVGVISLLKRCKQLKHLDINVHRLTSSGLIALAKAPLDRLLLSNGQHLSPLDLGALLGQGVEGPSTLRLLSLLNFECEWTSEQIRMFFNQHPHLEGLALYNFFIRMVSASYADPILWHSLSERLQHLQELSFSPLYAVDLQSILEYAPNLRSLTCILEDAITDHLCSSFVLCTPSIEEVVLRDPGGMHFPDLSDEGLQALARCTRLRTLKLIRMKSSYRMCSDMGIVYVVMQCHSLETLALQGFTKLSDTALSAICSNLKNLKHLHLQGCRSLSGWAFYPSSSCQNTVPKGLKSLNLSQCREIGSESLQYVIKQCEDLEDLNVAACSVDDSLIPYLRLSPCLCKLVLMSCSISDIGLCALASGQLKENEVWSDIELKHRLCSLPMPALTMFGVRGCWKVSDVGLTALVTAGLLKKIKCLDLTGLPLLTNGCISLLSKECPFIQQLKLKDCPLLSDESIQYLQESKCEKILTVLDLSKCNKMSRTALQLLYSPFFPRLTYLDLENFPAKKRDLEALAENKKYAVIASSVLSPVNTGTFAP